MPACLRPLEGAANVTVAVLSDGIQSEGDQAAFETLLSGGASRLVWAEPSQLPVAGLTGVENTATAFSLTAIRPTSDIAPLQLTAGAFDDRGRRIADAVLAFGPGEATATANVEVPFELRNDFASVSIDGEAQAGAIRVLDENSKRRRIGLLS